MDNEEHKFGAWDHRVVRVETAEEVLYQVYEVYYDEDGKIDMWSKDAVTPDGETLDELRENIQSFLAATDKPILEKAELKEGSSIFLWAAA